VYAGLLAGDNIVSIRRRTGNTLLVVGRPHFGVVVDRERSTP